MKSFLLLLVILSTSQIIAQGKLIVETDKSNYNYGETIKVTVTILNDTDTSFTIWGSSSCRTFIDLDSVDFVIACTADSSPLFFPKYSSQSWVWELDPTVLGIPTFSGEHIIYGYTYHTTPRKDTVKITAPKYYGGYVQVTIKKETTNEEMQLLRDSLNVNIISSSTSPFDSSKSEVWQIFGHSIDSLAIVYSNDSRFRSFYAERWPQSDSSFVTSTDTEILLSNNFVLSQNYPNPFNPSTTIKYSIPKSGFVSVKIFDSLGREITTLVHEEQSIGDYKINFYSSELSSGIYFYQLRTKDYVETKKMLLLK